MVDVSKAIPQNRVAQIRMITTGVAFANPLGLLGPLDRKIVGRIIGRVSDVGYTTQNNRETGLPEKLYHLAGLFEAMNFETNQIYRSAKIGLPMHIMSPIIELFKNNDSVSLIGVEMGLDIGLEKSKAALGYSWYCESLLDETLAENDPLHALKFKFKMLPEVEVVASLASPSPVSHDKVLEHKQAK